MLRVQYIVLYSKVDIVRVLHGCTQYTVGNVCAGTVLDVRCTVGSVRVLHVHCTVQ